VISLAGTASADRADVKLGKNAKGFTILAKGAETYDEEEK
jgi:hypothetical protein